MYKHYDQCYAERETEGIAVFGMCGGLYGDDNHTELQYKCIDCPYNVTNNKK